MIRKYYRITDFFKTSNYAPHSFFFSSSVLVSARRLYLIMDIEAAEDSLGLSEFTITAELHPFNRSWLNDNSNYIILERIGDLSNVEDGDLTTVECDIQAGIISDNIGKVPSLLQP